jgi:hypothetical protein
MGKKQDRFAAERIKLILSFAEGHRRIEMFDRMCQSAWREP